jgi:hypothetical protein
MEGALMGDLHSRPGRGVVAGLEVAVITRKVAGDYLQPQKMACFKRSAGRPPKSIEKQ